jgi:hypothetical protein
MMSWYCAGTAKIAAGKWSEKSYYGDTYSKQDM